MSRRLVINEIYLSVQGESSFAGLPCVFIRTTGCPLRCSWCDTPYAFTEGEETTVDAVLAQVASYGDVPLVEVTGGEPLVQKSVLPLLTALCDAGREGHERHAGHEVLLETSGAFDIADVDPRVHVIMDIKCPDSGEMARNRWANVDLLRGKDEVKFVLASRRDYEFARDVIREHDLPRRASVLLSAAFGRLDGAQVVKWMLDDHLPVRFQLQLHKLLWDPTRRGV